MALGEDLLGVATLVGIHRIEAKIVNEEQVDGDELAEFGLVGLIEAGVLEGLEQAIGAQRQDRVPAAAGDVAEGVGEEGLADPDRADDRHVGVGFEEAQRDELVEEGRTEGITAIYTARSTLLTAHH